MIKTLTGEPSLVKVDFDTPPSNPLLLLQEWLETADARVNEPRGLVLSTADSFGKPSSRVVLLKDCLEGGITFGTNQYSIKGRDLDSNPWAAGTLWWRETVQQVNFQGPVIRLSEEESDKMFYGRPREAQAVAALSKQSVVLINETTLHDAVCQLLRSNDQIKRPPEWHAYYLAIESIEFWHGSKDRFHKRLKYDYRDDFWEHKKLQP